MHARTVQRPRARRPVAALAGASLIILAGLGWSASGSHVLAQDAPALFDSSTVHEIAVAYDQAGFDAMVVTYQETAQKDWIEATVTIDGSTYEDVGIRLKGNSSLMSLRGGFGGRDTTGLEPGGVGGPGGRIGASADEPDRLPWLIRLDRNVDDQDHQGITEFVVRSNNSQTSLNEAVALDLLDAAGLASQQAAPTSFSVNGSEPVLRLIIENPNDAWQTASFEGDGALYKAESTGDWSYRGDDPGAYDEIFDQEAGKDVTDLAPLMALLQFINEADAATFAAELPERFDVDAFATYLAMMDLVDNFDDIDGPGNNAYLHWDAATGMFTIVPWDMNLAFGGMGGGRGPGGFGGDRGGRPPEGFQPIGPDASIDPAASVDPRRVPDRAGPGMGGPGGRNRRNPLVEKLHADAGFEALYQERLTTLRAELYDGGVAQDILDRWTGVLTAEASGLVDEATITVESASIAEAFAAP